MASPLDVDPDSLPSFRSYDDRITAPLHGFAGVDDYYNRSSSRPFLRRITVATLILHARDDPFMFPETCPSTEELGPAVVLELSEHGGHVGFVQGPTPWQARYWLDHRILAHLGEMLGKTHNS
jgi:predicted alpha/beta-fold hydrolase